MLSAPAHSFRQGNRRLVFFFDIVSFRLLETRSALLSASSIHCKYKASFPTLSDRYTLVQCFGFLEINNIKLNFLFSAIFDLEVKPLQMSSCICVNSHEKIILIFTNFYDRIKISTLEVALKGKFGALFDGWVHAFENTGMFGLEVGVKFSKISGHMLIIRSHGTFVLKGVISLHFLVHFEAALKPGTYLRREIPRKITLSLYLDPKEVSSSITSSLILASKLKGMGPMILFLGLHPITMSGSSE